MASTAANKANPSPEFVASPGNRRRRVRHRVQTPAYASLNSTRENPAIELQEIVNISEDGLAIQVLAPLREQETLDMSLDLAETGARIEVRGQVIWLGSGKAGIRFCEMPADVQRKLQEWLFMNAMVACAYGAEEQRIALGPYGHEAVPPPQSKPATAGLDGLRTFFPGDYTTTLAALEAVRREVRLAGGGDTALQLIAERAMAFTRATGAAIALTAEDELVCRASAGPDAPSLGMRFKAGEGFSGECVRSGQSLRCDDTESDPRVDRMSCRALGVRSMLAMPLRGQGSILGLLEVFSPQPNSFHAQDEVALQRLAEMAAEASHPAKSEGKSKRMEQLASAARVYDEVYTEASEQRRPRRVSIAQRFLFAGAGLAVIAAAVWVFVPLNPVHMRAARKVQGQQPAQTPPANLAGSPIVPQDFTGLRRLAEKGDPAAQFAVGAHYATGEDVLQDYTEALHWFTLAAEQGHVGAQSTLGAYYWSGRGAPQDLNKAYFWAVLAQSGGDDASRYRVAFLASRMTHAQVVAAQQRADEWIKAHEAASASSKQRD